MDMDKTIEGGKDNTKVCLDSSENLKTEETQTDITKYDVVLKLQPLNDIDIDI